MHDVHVATSPRSLSSRASFRWQQCVIRKHVRSDDLITFGAEKGESLVSAILSVKYSIGDDEDEVTLAKYLVHAFVYDRLTFGGKSL